MNRNNAVTLATVPLFSGGSRVSWTGGNDGGASCARRQQKSALKIFLLRGFLGEDLLTWPVEVRRMICCYRQARNALFTCYSTCIPSPKCGLQSYACIIPKDKNNTLTKRHQVWVKVKFSVRSKQSLKGQSSENNCFWQQISIYRGKKGLG